MAKAITTFEAKDGTNYPTAAGATIADLAAILGSTPAAEKLFGCRAAVETVLKEHDAITGAPVERIRAVK
jgi:hypothetical protein